MDVTVDADHMVSDATLEAIYDYLEEIQISIVSIYSAVEAIANLAIPDEYTRKVINNRQVEETWTKANIERWTSLTDKVGKFLPEILGTPAPGSITHWSRFLKLEALRNEIVHPKTDSQRTSADGSTLVTRLLDSSVFSSIGSGFEIIKLISLSDTNHREFPIGFGDNRPGIVIANKWPELTRIGPKI